MKISYGSVEFEVRAQDVIDQVDVILALGLEPKFKDVLCKMREIRREAAREVEAEGIERGFMTVAGNILGVGYYVK